jgi:hypothetical protein
MSEDCCPNCKIPLTDWEYKVGHWEVGPKKGMGRSRKCLACKYVEWQAVYSTHQAS